MVEQALVAAGAGDVVVVIDSASTDGTAEVARDAGAAVIPAPLGKGAAMGVACERLATEWICFLDGDLTDSEHNIPALLAREVRSGGGSPHVVGDFDDGLDAVLTNTDGFYRPLVRALFPEVSEVMGSKPLTGFRALRADSISLPLPPHFGVEAHLNITTTLLHGAPAVVPLGRFTGRLKANRTRTTEITGAVLDLAERFGRLHPRQRPAWQAWVDDVLRVALGWHADDDQGTYRAALMGAASRPLPSATA
ncbi:glycosyltransferase [Geodermatophilus sp. CPCC 205761]